MCLDKLAGKDKCDPVFHKCLNIFNGKGALKEYILQVFYSEWEAKGCSKCSDLKMPSAKSDCYEWETDMCNEKEEPKGIFIFFSYLFSLRSRLAKTCQNSTNQPEVCQHPNKCFTIKKGGWLKNDFPP